MSNESYNLILLFENKRKSIGEITMVKPVDILRTKRINLESNVFRASVYTILKTLCHVEPCPYQNWSNW